MRIVTMLCIVDVMGYHPVGTMLERIRADESQKSRQRVISSCWCHYGFIWVVGENLCQRFTHQPRKVSMKAKYSKIWIASSLDKYPIASRVFISFLNQSSIKEDDAKGKGYSRCSGGLVSDGNRYITELFWDNDLCYGIDLREWLELHSFFGELWMVLNRSLNSLRVSCVCMFSYGRFSYIKVAYYEPLKYPVPISMK